MRLLELISPNGALSNIDPYDFIHKGQSASGGGSDEFFDPDFDDEMTPPDNSIDKFMKKYGFQKLGAGAYASVFTRKDKNYAIKVFIDEPYRKFVAFARGYKNPHFPVFYTQPRIIPSFKRDFGDTIYFVKMEKLLPLKSFDKNLQTWYDYFCAKRRGQQIHFNKATTQFEGQTGEKLLARLNELPRDSFMSACFALEFLCERNGIETDFSENNVMRRADGTLVITDPVQEPFVH